MQNLHSRTIRLFPAAFSLCAALTGCGGGSNPGQLLQGPTATVIPLSSGTVKAQAGQFCVGIANIPQAPGGTITHAHVGGFMYTLAGVHTLQISGSADVNSTVGQAAFVGDSVTHTHANLQSTSNSWNFIAMRPAGKCAAAPPVPGASVVYASPDEPALPNPTYTETLSEVDLPAGASTSPHNAATEAFLVLSGSVQFISNGQSTVVGANQGFIDASGVTAQEIDGGSGSRMLLFSAF